MQSIHALGVLVGKPPETLTQELQWPDAAPGPTSRDIASAPTTQPGLMPATAPAPPPTLAVLEAAPPTIPPGLPSDLLRRRPDIRAAERQLAAASANIGVATADLFPRFTLTGSYGFQSEHFKDLPNDSSNFWQIIPGFRWPIFNAGRIRSNIAVESARQEQALANYEQTVLRSLADVEDALTNYDRERARREELARSVSANRRAVDLSNQLYSRGLIDFLGVLDAERQLFASEDQLAASDTIVSSNLVAVYKALGGGWQAEPASDQR
jgi:NodT family efflux transporter outer membrane factor (OMF) lipoprotein